MGIFSVLNEQGASMKPWPLTLAVHIWRASVWTHSDHFCQAKGTVQLLQSDPECMSKHVCCVHMDMWPGEESLGYGF